MALVDLKNMDVDALLELRADVGRRLTEQARDLQRQLSLLSGRAAVRGRPAGRSGRPSGLKGTKVPPKFAAPAARHGPDAARSRGGSRLCLRRGTRWKSSPRAVKLKRQPQRGQW